MGQKTETDGKRRFRPGETASDEQQYERYVMIGGYENPVQTMPSGEGNFYFESNDPGRIDSFYAPNADLLLRQIYLHFGAVDIVRMHGYTWSVEDSGNIYGTISEIVGRKPSILECLAPSKETASEYGSENRRAGYIVVYRVSEASP